MSSKGGKVKLQDIPDGTIFAVLTYHLDRNFCWQAELFRKAEAGIPERRGVVHGQVKLGSDLANTLWGAKRAARKLYRRYLRRRKLGDGHTITMIMGREEPK